MTTDNDLYYRLSPTRFIHGLTPLCCGKLQGSTLMIGYVVLGTNDLPRAAAFYDTLLGEIGLMRQMDFGERGYAWVKTQMPSCCAS